MADSASNLALNGLFLLYPLAIYLGLQWLEPLALAALIPLLAGLRIWLSRSLDALLLLVAACLVLAGTWLLGSSVAIKLYPALVNLTLLWVFVHSLISPPTVIERLARLTDPGLDAAGVRYTRRATQVWCGFFVVNGSIAAATAAMSDEIWLLYNGLIAYVAMAGLFVAEFTARYFHKRRQHERQLARPRQ